MAFNFFTDSIASPQLADMAYGPLANSNGDECFHLENTFIVAQGAPAFAVTKSIIIAVESEAQGNDLLNIACFPIENNFMAGFPIKFFLYRGIEKSSLLAATGNLQLADNTWNDNNILTIIQDHLTELNEGKADAEKIIGDGNVLGLQFGNQAEDRNLESIILDPADDFQPLIVPGGCQIGKFKGGDFNAGIQVILDKIGNEPKISLLKKENHILKIPILNESSTDSDKTKIKNRFINRLSKEEVLAYMDITAFYGSCRNQGIRIKGVNSQNTFLSQFHNKSIVYLDIRDKRGYAINHFLNLPDYIKVGFYDTDKNINYAILNNDSWPIFRLENYSFPTSKKLFFVKFPIHASMPTNANILTSFNRKVSYRSSRRDRKYMLLNEQQTDGSIGSDESEFIRFKNWEYSNNLGANHFLLKLDITKPIIDKTNTLTPIWNNFFSLEMKNIFNISDIVDGEFRVKTFSTLNVPALIGKDQEQLYYPVMGIAADKNLVTFFTFYLEPAKKFFQDFENVPQIKVIDTGKYNYDVDEENLEYASPEQAIGFLYQFVNNDKISDYELVKSNFTIPQQDGTVDSVEFMHYKKIGETNLNDDFVDNFQAISLTHSEYSHLQELAKQSISQDDDFITEHPMFISSRENLIYNQNKFIVIENLLTLGVAKIYEKNIDEKLEIDFQAYPLPIELMGEPIVLRSVNFK